MVGGIAAGGNGGGGGGVGAEGAEKSPPISLPFPWIVHLIRLLLGFHQIALEIRQADFVELAQFAFDLTARGSAVTPAVAQLCVSAGFAIQGEVEAALGRIEENSYGKCVACGQEIPEGRLDARPDAARCVGCQAKDARRR